MEREGTTRNTGLSFYYRILGTPREDRPPVMALHGGPGGSHDILVPGAAPLARTRAVIFYDQRGCGRSDRLSEDTSCTLADNVADLEHLRRTLVAGPVDLMGHSWGGLLALAYALDYGGNVRRLILIAPAVTHYPNASWSDFLATLTPDVLSAIAVVRENRGYSPVARQAAVWRLTIREFFHRREVLDKIDLEAMPFSPQVGIRLIGDLDGLDLRPRLAHLRIPTLIVAGRHDRRLPLSYHENLAALLPDASLEVFENSGHFPFLEEPERFACVVDEFLR